MSALDTLDWHAVREHYDERVQIHRELLALRRDGKVLQFVRLLLGISNPSGNYSAAEHALGPQVLAMNGASATDRVFDLANKFKPLTTARDVPRLIKEANLQHLKIGVGSEASCMVNPEVCWVVNTRTVWTHLVIKHADDIEKANEELRLYREADPTSEMAYQIWAEIHRELAASMTRIAEEGAKLARQAGVKPGTIKYLWADAIANALYALHNE